MPGTQESEMTQSSSPNLADSTETETKMPVTILGSDQTVFLYFIGATQRYNLTVTYNNDCQCKHTMNELEKVK